MTTLISWQPAQHESLGKKHLSIISLTVFHLLQRYSGESHYQHKNIFSGKGPYFSQSSPSLPPPLPGQRHLHAIYMSLEQLQALQTAVHLRMPPLHCCWASAPLVGMAAGPVRPGSLITLCMPVNGLHCKDHSEVECYWLCEDHSIYFPHTQLSPHL